MLGLSATSASRRKQSCVYDADFAACGDAAGQAPAQQGQAQQQQKTALQLRQARKTERRKPRRLAQQAARLQAAGSNLPSTPAVAAGAAAASAPPAQAAAQPRPDAGLAESEAQLARMAAECVQRQALRKCKGVLAQETAAEAALRAAQHKHLAAMLACARQLQPSLQPQQHQPRIKGARERKRKRRGELPLLQQVPEVRQALDTFLALGGLRFLGSCVPDYMLVSGRHTAQQWHTTGWQLQRARACLGASVTASWRGACCLA